eukprot:scaffold451_cov121-Cylindrotheca_fusiformis.AAC.1
MGEVFDEVDFQEFLKRAASTSFVHLPIAWFPTSLASQMKDHFLVDLPGFVQDDVCQLCCAAHRYRIV